jgi:hypothetical protein
MPRILHILTQTPDGWIQSIIRAQQTTPDIDVQVADLTCPDADYDQLLDEIFEADTISVW